MDEHHILHVIDLIFDKMRERLCNGDFSFLLMPLYPGFQSPILGYSVIGKF